MSPTFQQALDAWGPGFMAYSTARAELHAGEADKARRRELQEKMDLHHGSWLSYVRAVSLEDGPPTELERQAARLYGRAV